MEELHRDPTVGPRPKVWTRDHKWKKLSQRWRAKEAQVQNYPGGRELDLVQGGCMRCKKNSPLVLSCIGKRKRDGCDCGSEAGTIYSR